MSIQTKFLTLYKPAAVGDDIDGWRVSWAGGWDRRRIVFHVMVELLTGTREEQPQEA